MQIDEHVFLVTGGASGLGEATARRLADQGARVVIADLQDEAGKRLAHSYSGSMHYVRCDVTNEADGQRAVDAALETFDALDGLVNCAGTIAAEKTLGKDGPHNLGTFSQVVQVNLIGTFNMIRLAAAVMADSEPNRDNERGVIVNTASVAAYDGQVGQAAYAASKAGVAGLTLPVARDLARSGIRVMTIAPGLFETPMLNALPEDARESLGRMVPFPPRLGRPDEFARLVEAIIGNPMLNGETIRLDGAIRMQPK